MALYHNTNSASAIASVDFTPVPDGNNTFFFVKGNADDKPVRAWLAQQGQQVESEVKLGDQTVIVTRGEKTRNELVRDLAARGDTLQADKPKWQLHPWKLRGNFSTAGQIGQLASGFYAAKAIAESDLIANPKLVHAQTKEGRIFARKGMDKPILWFAGLNLIANFTNVIFGAEKSDDPHQLAFLKDKSNKLLADYVPPGTEFPKVSDQRAPLRNEPAKPKTIGDKVHDFIKHNSVRAGEIGLRYAASIALVLPPGQWKAMGNELRAGNFKSALDKGLNKENGKLSLTGKIGIAYLLGKSIALFSEVPDPYNKEKKHTWVDTVREKALFPLSSATEAVAAFLIAKNGLMNKKVIIGGKLMRDFPGGIGGALFTTGLIIRMFAKFGVREVNMDELNAHVSDSLALVPPDKLPEAVAKSAAMITEHFKDKHLEFGKVYSQIVTDLYRNHNIALPGTDGSVDAPAVADAPAMAAAPETAPPKVFARPEMKNRGLAAMQPIGSFKDIAVNSNGAAHGIAS